MRYRSPSSLLLRFPLLDLDRTLGEPSGSRRSMRTAAGRSGALIACSLAVGLMLACGGGDGGNGETAPSNGSAAPADEAPAASGALTPPLGTATVSGTVTLAGEAPRVRPIVMGADPQCEAKHDGPVANPVLQLADDGGLGSVLVRVRWTGGAVAAPAEAKVIDQNGCLYTPRVVGVQVGQTLQILNSDQLLHNVHSTSEENPPFNRAMPAAVTQSELKFSKVEDPFLVKCDVHPWMAAYVAVLDHPFYAVTGDGGSFEISGLPAGTYELEAWHERLGTRTATVTVEDGGTASADFTFEPPA